MATRSKAVEPVEAPQLPALRPTASSDFDVDSSDIQLPRIKGASPTSGAVADLGLPLYCIFSQHGRDDDEPTQLVDPPTAKNEKDDNYGLKVYVLRMYKNLAANVDPYDWQRPLPQDEGGELRTWAFGDTSAPQFAKTQYNYVLYVPESPESDMPHNLLLAKSGTPTARLINTYLIRKLQEGVPIHATAWRLTPFHASRTTESGQKQNWCVIKARVVEADATEVAAAQALVEMMPEQREQPEAAVSNTVSDAAPAI